MFSLCHASPLLIFSPPILSCIGRLEFFRRFHFFSLCLLFAPPVAPGPLALATLSVQPAAQKPRWTCFVKCCVKDREPCLGVISPRLFVSWRIFKGPALKWANLRNPKAPLEVLVPDPLKAKEREEGRRREKEGRDEKVKGWWRQRSSRWLGEWQGGDRGFPAAPQTRDPGCHWAVNLVATWSRPQLPWIEDGKSWGVALQEKMLEPRSFHTRISRGSSEWGDAARQPRVCNYRQLERKLGEAEVPVPQWWSWRSAMLALLRDIILKNFETLKKPRVETKGMPCWEPPLSFWDGSGRDLLSRDSRLSPTFLPLSLSFTLAPRHNK